MGDLKFDLKSAERALEIIFVLRLPQSTQPKMVQCDDDLDKLALENFKHYLNIPSELPNVDYEPCVAFLAKLAKDAKLNFNIYRIIPNKPSVVLTWPGIVPFLQSVMLNSCMGVPSVTQGQKASVFIDGNDNIHAPGAQSSKCVGIQYLEAIRRLKLKGFKPKRSVHITFLSGKPEDTESFLKSPQFKSLDVGFALDEGVASEDNTLTAYCSNKHCWRFSLHCYGKQGHASLLLDGTAAEKVDYLLSKFYEFRNEQKEIESKVQDNDQIITVNLTVMKGGGNISQIPKKLSLSFDTRSPLDKFEEFVGLVRRWCTEAGGGIVLENYAKDIEMSYAQLGATNPFWLALKASVENMKIPLKGRVASGRVDGSQLRASGVPTVGFNPNRNTPRNNCGEVLNVRVFLEGVAVFEEVIAGIAKA